MDLKNCVFIAGGDDSIAKLIVKRLNTKLTNRTLDFFSDGEVHTQILEDIQGKDVFIIDSTTPPIDQHLFPVLLLADAARRGFAKSINFIVPYFGYARQDRMAEPNTPISSKVIADILHSVHINHVITVDLHSTQTQGFFDMTIENIEVETLFADYIKKNIKSSKYAIVSPDVGGAKRARKIADLVNCKDIIILDKNRYAKNKSEVMHIIGDPKEKDLIIVDDMIDTAGTISSAVTALKSNGGKAIYIMATHPVFSGNAIKNLSSPDIDQIIITNTIPLKHNLSNLQTIDISSTLVNSIRKMMH